MSIDERRCKFKPALLQQDKRAASAENTEEDIREVFFPGNHGDIGGGWMAPGNNAANEADDPLQLSDIALEWMISELDALPAKHPTDKLEWNDHRDIFLQNYNRKVATAVQAPMHDILRYGGGVSPVSTFLWRIMGKIYDTILYWRLLTDPFTPRRISTHLQAPRAHQRKVEIRRIPAQHVWHQRYLRRRRISSLGQGPDGLVCRLQAEE